MKRDISKELFLFLIVIHNKINEKSMELYKNNIEDLLQEPSHSFGFKPFSDLSDLILDGISEIYDNEIMLDYFYEDEFTFYFNNKEEIKITLKNEEDLYHFANYFLIKETTTNNDFLLEKRNEDKYKMISLKLFNKTEELLNLLIKVCQNLTKIENEIGDRIRMLLTSLQNDTEKHSFYPAYEIKDFIYQYVDKYILRKENNFLLLEEEMIEELISEGSGIFYIYCENSEFGIKETKIYINDIEYIFKDNNLIKILGEINENRNN